MTVTINGTTGVSGVAGSASTPALIGSDADSGYYINSANEPSASVNGTAVWNANSTFGFKNRIINGAMTFDQRNAGASVSSGGFLYTLDRWNTYEASSGQFSIQQTTTAPAGFTNSMKFTVTTTQSSLGAADQYIFWQAIEGFNTADLSFGSASAKPVTVSFWTRSSVTGTYPVSLINNASNRSIVSTFTINSADTWEYKTITFAGDQSGTWTTDNTTGIYVRWSLGAGSNFVGTANTWNGGYLITTSGCTNLMATNGATFYITGVQLEKGSTATSFDFRSYGTELALCQRYYNKSFEPSFAPAYGATGISSAFVPYTTSNGYGTFVYQYPVQMRAIPTVTFYNAASGSNVGTLDYFAGSVWVAFTSVAAAGASTNLTVFCTKSSSFTAFSPVLLSGNWTASAEL